MRLVPGALYPREQLHLHFGGQRQGGISTPRKHPVVLLFSSPSGEVFGYRDGWLGDVYLYSGEGVQGDMTLTRGNRVILNHREQGRKLLLFVRTRLRGPYLYLGEFVYAGHFWSWAPDLSRSPRRAVTFFLEPVEAVREGPEAKLTPEQVHFLQQGRLEGASERVQTYLASRYSRSAAIARETLRRAKGKCELCGAPAPFLDLIGEPFLEVHHILPLSEGGPDTMENTAALCPNCHRAAHYSARAPEIRQKLLVVRLGVSQ